MNGDRGREMPSPLDGRLVRLLDDELTDAERAELLEMLDTSAEVRARYEELRALSSRLTDLLEGQAVPPVPELALPKRPASRASWGAPWLRVAAGVALLLAVGLTVEPVRAWLTTGMQRVVELIAPPDGELVVEEAPPPAQDTESPSAVSFLPQGSAFVVEVRAAQVQGMLTVESVSDTDAVTASVVGGSGETLVVLPSGLGISNAAGSVADYRVTVPSALTTVEVRVEDALVATLVPTDSPGRWEIPLSPR